MEALTLIGLVTAAGFVFKKLKPSPRPISSQHNTEKHHSYTISNNNTLETDEQLDDEIEVLPEYLLVKKLIEKGWPLVFVTGSAGTGKSTFINWLVEEFNGEVLLAAPTAIAAINIGGKTLHSLFHLPLGFLTQDDIKNGSYRTEIKNAKLLIIDEISMVNPNILDGVSSYIRLSKGGSTSFGGMPVVMVGDLFQLPPVIKDSIRWLFYQHYASDKFFCSRSLADKPYYAVELKKTFRQKDQEFVDLLSDIREGKNLKSALLKINSRCKTTSTPPIGSICLAPRRREVEKINMEKLNSISSPQHEYLGYIEGTFKADESSLPSPTRLLLKVDSQVMFTQNDPQKRWINGTVGTVTHLTNNTIIVEIHNSIEVVKVEKTKWPEFRYTWNRFTKEIEKEEIGCYVQYPLLLAWAVTIHKSQGKTIDKVHLELGRGAFSFGQTYVALSRCRTLEGITLSKPITEADIKVDADTTSFYEELRKVADKNPTEVMLEKLDRLQ